MGYWWQFRRWFSKFWDSQDQVRSKVRTIARSDVTVDVESANGLRNVRVLVAGPLRGVRAQGLFVLVPPACEHELGLIDQMPKERSLPCVVLVVVVLRCSV